MPIKLNKTLKILKQALFAKQNFIKTIIKILGCYKMPVTSQGNHLLSMRLLKHTGNYKQPDNGKKLWAL
jgi:hypothetical protein